MSHLKHNAVSGHLLKGPTNHLVNACGEEACPCPDTVRCDNCSDATPTQFHVTFTGVTLCTGCVNCDALGVSVRLADGSSIDGTYLLTHNGACAWTAFSTGVPCSGSLYASNDCSGTGEPVGFAVQQVRINATQFRLQITDDSNTLLLFDAIVDAAKCCASYTIDNALSACGCGEDGTSLNLATGGMATVTPC